MIPTWKAATYRPEAPAGSSGEVRIAEACSIGGNAVDAAPQTTTATAPSTTAARPDHDLDGQHRQDQKRRRQHRQATQHRGLGPQVQRDGPRRPSHPGRQSRTAASSQARCGPCIPTTSRMITTMKV